jgi:competence protein ComEA
VGAAVAFGLAGVLLLAAFLLATQSGRGEIEVRPASAGGSGPPVGSPGPGSAGSIVVEVAGAVVRPGLHTLPAGTRVGEAIAAAGGYSPRVDTRAAERDLNLAAPLRDGDRVRVPSRDDPDPTAPNGTTGGGAGGGEDASARLLNVNRATAAELEALPGIGPATAAKIISARAERPFARVDELLERKLVSSKVMEAIRGLVTVG